MNKTTAHEQRKRRASAGRIEDQIEAHKRKAELARVYTEGVDSLFWRTLKAEIEKRRAAFERGSLTMGPEVFSAEQGRVRGMVALIDMVEQLVGKRDYYLDLARQGQEAIDAAVRGGQLAPRE